MKSLKNIPENLQTMTDSIRLRPLFWKFLITGAMFGDVLICLLINKRAFSLVEKCRVTSWPSTVVIFSLSFSSPDPFVPTFLNS